MKFGQDLVEKTSKISSLIAVLLYGSKTWRMTKEDDKNAGCVLTQEPASDTEDLVAKAHSKRGD